MREAELKHFSPKQRRVLTWWCGEDAEKDAIICDGAVRSGKTMVMGVSFFCWAMKNFDRRQFGLCGKTISALRRNVLQEVLTRLRRLGFQCEEKRTENLLIVRFGGHENRFYLFGGKDESSAALIQGITFAGVLLDEVALMPRSFVEQACARCSVAGSRLWFNCNPEGPQHWFYREWILQAEQRNALRLHFTMEDNPSLSAQVRERYERSYSGLFYRRFVLGEWSAARGLVYEFFERERFCREAPQGDAARYWVSIDYGTVNPTSMGLWGEYGGVWYRVEEYYYNSREEERQMTDTEYVAALRRLLRGRGAEKVIVDPSAASFMEALRREGYRVVKADNRVLDGIRLTADWLKQGRMVITAGCEDCLREMELYCWEEDGGKDTPRKEHDHAMDEMRYFAMEAAKRPRYRGFCAGAVERSRE